MNWPQNMICSLNALTSNGRQRNRDAKRAALQYPSYLSRGFTEWAFSLR